MAFTANKYYTCDTCNNPIAPGEEFSWSRRGPKKYYCWRHTDGGNKPSPEDDDKGGEDEDGYENPGKKGDFNPEEGGGPGNKGSKGNESGKGDGKGEGGGEGKGDGDDMNKYDMSLPKDMEHMREWLKNAGMMDADFKDEQTKQVLKELYEEWLKEHPEEAVGSDNHDNYNLLLTYVKAGEHVYLWGPAGSGKSTAAEMVAEDLGLNYGYVSLDPYASSTCLIGYMNATGHYVPTPFYDIYKNGGLYCVDELDNASSALLVTLNSALANGMCAFPCGMVKRHPDFRLIATGNTDGKGGTPQYPERRMLDSAVLDRYLAIKWDYDEKLELKIALDIDKTCGREAAKFVQEVRKRALDLAPDLIVSPRATIRIAKLMKTVPKRTLVENVIFKGYDEGVVSEIMKGMWNKWETA